MATIYAAYILVGVGPSPGVWSMVTPLEKSVPPPELTSFYQDFIELL